MEVSSCLGCSNQEIVELKILREVRKASNRAKKTPWIIGKCSSAYSRICLAWSHEGWSWMTKVPKRAGWSSRTNDNEAQNQNGSFQKVEPETSHPGGRQKPFNETNSAKCTFYHLITGVRVQKLQTGATWSRNSAISQQNPLSEIHLLFKLNKAQEEINDKWCHFPYFPFIIPVSILNIIFGDFFAILEFTKHHIPAPKLTEDRTQN